MKVFWDTNVLIDFLLVRSPFYLPASTMLTFSEEGQLDICVSTLSIVTAQYVCCERAKMPLNIWKKKMLGLRSFVKFCKVDSSILFAACESEWKDFEDCVQYNCAVNEGCDYIITRNQKDYSLSEIVVVEPEKFIDILI